MWNKKRTRVFIPIVCILFFVTGCKVKPPAPPLVETVAILLFDNESNNVDADTNMQRLVYLAMVLSPYRVSNIDDTNAKLKEVGIIDGGQLPTIDPMKLGRDLGVQALMYGNVESFGYLNIGVYYSRKVTLELKLVSVDDGSTLWEGIGKHATRTFAVEEEEIKKNFAKGLADQATDKIFNMPLAEEAKLATAKALRTLPGFRFRGFATDDKTPSGAKKAGRGIMKSIIRNK